MDKPLPCPFCGDKELFISREVYCEKCGCYGPEAMNEEYAIKFWNERLNNTQEPKTPIKEQIDIVAKELFDKDFLPKPVHMNKWKTAPDYVKYRYKFYAQLAIETWEKIRNKQ